MKASELRPKQFFHFTGDTHKQLCRNIGNAYQFLAEEEMSGNEEVIPLDVQGWDEPKVDPDRDPEHLLKLLSHIVSHAQYSSAHVDFVKVPAYLLDEPKRILEQSSTKVQPPKLQLREGAWYRTVKGEVLGPFAVYNNRDNQWHIEENDELLWSGDGKEILPSNRRQPYDLIAEVAPPSPIEQFAPPFQKGDWVVRDIPESDCAVRRVEATRQSEMMGSVLIDGKWESAARFRRATPEEVAAHEQAQEPEPDADGWILLSPGETIQDGDEFFFSDDTWGKSYRIGHHVRTGDKYRRLVAPKPIHWTIIDGVEVRP